MMRSRRFLRNSAKLGLSVLVCIGFSSCTLKSQSPTYKCNRIAESLSAICQKEYKLPVRARLVGSTLWAYLPIQGNLFTKSDHFSTKTFEILALEGEHHRDIVDLSFFIKSHPKTKEPQGVDLTKDVRKTLNDLHMCVTRIIMSSNCGVNFVVQTIAGTKDGSEITFIMYVPDLKKYTYNLLSSTEFSLRRIFEVKQDPSIIGDVAGTHMAYTDITIPDFLLKQIKQRIEVNFQSEDSRIADSDIDSEVLKIISSCLKIYNYNGFSWIEIRNLAGKKSLLLNRKGLDDFNK